MAKKDAVPEQVGAAVPDTRERFRALLVANPNHFGKLTDLAGLDVIDEKSFDRTFEELGCVSYSPGLDRIEATVVLKRSNGYGGGPCTDGSYEHLRFYIDDGSGWEDAGLASVNVHDIPAADDCEGRPSHPLTYVCGVDHRPRRQSCRRPVLPRVRVILSWNLEPPAGQPDWPAPWGDRHDCNVQISPRPLGWHDIADQLPDHVLALLPDLVLPEVPTPGPQPDPGPVVPHSLLGLARSAPGQEDVPAHRFALPALAELSTGGALDIQSLSSSTLAAQHLGISLPEVMDAIQATSSDTTYEELECLGLERVANADRLVASFRVKLPSGYSGPPCEPGSVEHVAFWADWDDACTWQHLGTVETVTHDYARLPEGGLCYAAVLPVDLGGVRRGCETPVLRRVRAVLSWGAPPSTTDPDEPPVWGGRLDAHVQVQPGRSYDGTARFVVVGGVPADQVTASGLTAPLAQLEGQGLLDPRGCPFAGRVRLHGPTDPALVNTTYRIVVRNLTQGGGVIPLLTPFQTIGGGQTWPSLTTYWNPPGPDGWMTWLGFGQNNNGLLGVFQPSGDDRWEVQLEVQGLGVVDTKVVQVDNTLRGPASPVDPDNTADLELDLAGQCELPAGMLRGRFVARDRHFSSWSISVAGGPAAGFPTPPPPTAPGPPGPPLDSGVETPLAGQDFQLDLSSLPPCGYTVRLGVSDRAIVNSHITGRTVTVERGLCIRS